MTDTTVIPAAAAPVTDPIVSWQWRLAVGIMTLIFNGGVVWWCMLYGVKDNLLHQNALSWSYITSVLVLAGLGIISALPTVLNTILTSKKS